VGSFLMKVLGLESGTVEGTIYFMSIVVWEPGSYFMEAVCRF
jgi:hypothetical protein